MPTDAWTDDTSLRDLELRACTLIDLGPAEAEAVAAVAAAAPAFFRLPNEAKLASRLGAAAGYRPYGIEYSNSPERPDEMETFTATAESASQRGLLPAGALELHDCATDAFRLLEPVAERFAVALAERLTGSAWSGPLRGGFHRWSCLQINHSHPTQTRSDYINEVHEDGHFLTLACATSEGLEVRGPEGDFAPVTTGPSQMVVMLGGIASLMTGGRLAPLFHRVRSVRDCAERTSILFFADLAPELCQPWIPGPNNRSVDIAAFVRDNPIRFGLQQYGSE